MYSIVLHVVFVPDYAWYGPRHIFVHYCHSCLDKCSRESIIASSYLMANILIFHFFRTMLQVPQVFRDLQDYFLCACSERMTRSSLTEHTSLLDISKLFFMLTVNTLLWYWQIYKINFVIDFTIKIILFAYVLHRKIL